MLKTNACLVLFMLLSVSFSFAATEVTDCTQLNQTGETYFITEGGFTNTDTLDSCIEVVADNIFLDCIGWSRIVNADSQKVLYVHNVENFTLADCSFTGGEYLVYIIFVNDSRITSLNVSGATQYDGLHVQTVLNSSFQNIYAGYNTEKGISILDVFDSQFSGIVSDSNSDIGIHVDSSNGNVFEDISCISNSGNAFQLTSSHFNALDNFSLSDVIEGISNNDAGNNNFTNGYIFDGFDGITFASASVGNRFANVTVDSMTNNGIYIAGSSDSNEFIGVAVTSGTYGVYVESGDANIFSGMNILGSSTAGIYFASEDNVVSDSVFEIGDFSCVEINAANNILYNNLFNCSGLIYYDFVDTFDNYWNATQQSGTRIFGDGTQVGGNYWATPIADGYSEGCDDNNTDGFCDDAYGLGDDNDIDYLALSNGYATTTTTSTTLLPTTTLGAAGSVLTDIGQGTNSLLQGIIPVLVFFVVAFGIAGALTYAFVKATRQ